MWSWVSADKPLVGGRGVQVVALAPQFVIASPEGDAEDSLGRTGAQLSELKLAKTSPATGGDSGSGGSSADQETKEGLKRLADLIRKKRREVPTDVAATATADPFTARILAFPTGAKVNKDRGSHENTPEVEAATALEERHVDQGSHEFTAMIVAWSQRPARKSMATVVREEMERRRGLGVYRAMNKSARSVLALEGEPYRPINTIS